MLMRAVCLILVLFGGAGRHLAGEIFTDPATGRERCRYSVSLPARASIAMPAGVIYALHPNGGSDGPMVAHTRRMLDGLRIGADYLVVGVKSVGSSWTRSFKLGQNQDLQNIVALHEFLSNQYPIDQRRIAVWGFSGGGMTACLLGVNRPEMMHTTLSLGGYGFDSVRASDPIAGAPLFYSAAGSRDPNWDFIERALPKQERAGLHWISYQIEGAGHSMSGPGLDQVLRDALQLMMIRRVAAQAPSPEEQALIERMALAAGNGDRLDQGDLAQTTRIGGAAAAAVTNALLRSDDRRALSTGIELAMSGAVNPATFPLLGNLAATGDQRRVMRPALAVLAQFARWRYPDAERQLERIAADLTLELARRQAALQAIGEALVLLSLGGRRDHQVYQALERLAGTDDAIAQAAAALHQRLSGQGQGQGQGQSQGQR